MALCRELIIYRQQGLEIYFRGWRLNFDDVDHSLVIGNDHGVGEVSCDVVDADEDEDLRGFAFHHFADTFEDAEGIVARDSPVACMRVSQEFHPVGTRGDAVAEEDDVVAAVRIASKLCPLQGEVVWAVSAVPFLLGVSVDAKGEQDRKDKQFHTHCWFDTKCSYKI